MISDEEIAELRAVADNQYDDLTVSDCVKLLRSVPGLLARIASDKAKIEAVEALEAERDAAVEGAALAYASVYQALLTKRRQHDATTEALRDIQSAHEKLREASLALLISCTLSPKQEQ